MYNVVGLLAHMTCYGDLMALPAWHVEQGLCNGTVAVRASVCPIYRPLQQRAAVCCWAPRGQELLIDSGGRPAGPKKL